MHTEAARKDTSGGSRLGGARADFVASLGRKVGDLRATLGRVRALPADASPRAELRRKLHALGSGAKLMKFDAMERAIAETAARLDRAEGTIDAATLDALDQLLEDMPALAWGEGPTRSSVEEKRVQAAAPRYKVLVVGSQALGSALLEPDDLRPTFGCETTPDAQAAYDVAIATDPDLVLLDADLACSAELVEALMDDPRTESVPVIVVGTFTTSSEEARFVAMGVARTMGKPTSPDALREACEATLDPRKVPVPACFALGEPTLEELSTRLADQIREALVTGVAPAQLGRRIPLGEGTEVLSALWGAIARVREVVTARTFGEVAFPLRGPEGAMPFATYDESDVARGDRARRRPRGPSAEVRLTGRRVVVADDDPAVVWFLADLLKTAGCTVYEAFDGEQALEAAMRTSPDLVVSDILMPKLDGFALCRALRRDVALRDVPVVLLSWKEDLLQRARELGAGAAGYVRKESDARAILARFREALRPRAHVETRLKQDGEVRGRLDDVSVRTLLDIVCATRPEARVSVRDAAALYEVEVRWGAPHRASRTARDGTFTSGTQVLGAMLGVSAGRFTVATSTGAVEAELDGNFAAQIAKPLARARAATALLGGARMMRIERLAIDEVALEEYLRATPDAAQSVARRLAAGTSPRTLILDGDCDPTLLEDLACDLAARGLVVGAYGASGEDLLGPMTAHFARHADARTAYAPKTPTPMPVPAVVDETAGPASAACAADVSTLCDSPLPGATSAIEEAIAHAEASPFPTGDLTPSKGSIVALAEPTLVDDTIYAPRDEAPSEAAPAVETPNARPVPLAVEGDEVDALLADERATSEEHDEAVAAAEEDRATFTPLTTVTEAGAADDVALAPTTTASRRLWPVAIFVVAAATIGWAFLRSAGGTEPATPPATGSAPPVESPVFAATAEPAPAPAPAKTVTRTATPTPIATSSAVTARLAPIAPKLVTAPASPDAIAVTPDVDERDCTTAARAGRAAHARP